MEINPVCGYCNGKHCNYECNQHNKAVHQLDTTEPLSEEDAIELQQHIDAECINFQSYKKMKILLH